MAKAQWNTCKAWTQEEDSYVFKIKTGKKHFGHESEFDWNFKNVKYF